MVLTLVKRVSFSEPVSSYIKYKNLCPPHRAVENRMNGHTQYT